MNLVSIVMYMFVTSIPGQIHGLLEQGIFNLKITPKNNLVVIPKSMYNKTKIALYIDCKSEDSSYMNFAWYLWWSPCANVIDRIGEAKFASLKDHFYPVSNTTDPSDLLLIPQQKSESYSAKCEGIIHLQEVVSTTTTLKTATTSSTLAPDNTATRKRRAIANLDKIDHQTVTTTKTDGSHIFILEMGPIDNDDTKYSADVVITMIGPHGYLSAIEWPLLPFYGCMCLVYLLYGVIWLALLACNWRDLLRIQFWIGGVIVIGMLEKAVFFGEFQSVNITGKSVSGALVFAEIVSSLKRALARVLVVIASLGFGIVKPRLGPMLHKVIGVGTLYFILASVESCVRVISQDKNAKMAMISSIPLAVLDAALCWWIFTSLVQTTRTLRLRRNVVKLSLYRHFTNTLIFAVLASVAYMIWSIKQYKFQTCLTDWREMWVDEAFWHILFCIILAVIMVLWRPSINNQRYAFSPLLDAAEEEDEYEDEEKTNNEALDAQKRSTKIKQVVPKDKSNDDDLKWIEDNIPASVADTALPSLLDSDEEIMTTKYEMSKME